MKNRANKNGYKISREDFEILKQHLNETFNKYEELEMDILSAMHCLDRIEKNKVSNLKRIK